MALMDVNTSITSVRERAGIEEEVIETLVVIHP